MNGGIQIFPPCACVNQQKASHSDFERMSTDFSGYPREKRACTNDATVAAACGLSHSRSRHHPLLSISTAHLLPNKLSDDTVASLPFLPPSSTYASRKVWYWADCWLRMLIATRFLRIMNVKINMSVVIVHIYLSKMIWVNDGAPLAMTTIFWQATPSFGKR